MKQLYCTLGERGQNGTSNGEPGVALRAASAGLEPDRARAILRHAGYASPPRGDGAAAEPPTRLALLQTPEAGRFLCHSTCLGIDPVTGKNGKFFSHVLLDVPATLDAQHAIQSWGSPLWQRREQGGAELPEALYLPVSPVLTDEELARVLGHHEHRDLLEFVLTALLTTAPQTRIFIAAPAEVVARCLHGVTRALPPSLLEGFTFSTYERDPQLSPARVVGTCWDTPDADLPAACYSQGVVYNTYAGRKSELPGEHPFAAFAVAALAEGRPTALDEFHATWQGLGLKEPGLFELVYRLARGSGALTKEESQQALHHPTLCTLLVGRPDALERLLEWALADQAYATTTFSRAVVALRHKPDVLARLAQAVLQRGLAALHEADLARTRNALEALMPMVAPARAAAVWEDLLASIPDPDALSWEMRHYLLPRLALLRSETLDAGLKRWLDVPVERLAAILALDLPEGCRLAACLACLRRDGEPSAGLARTLAAHPQMVLGALAQLPTCPDGEARAEALFGAVVAEAAGHAWGEEVVRHGRSLPAALLGRCLDVALDRGHTAAADLIAAGHGPALLELLAGKTTLDRIGAQLLNRPGDNRKADRARDEFLQALTGAAGLSAGVRARLEAYLGFRAFLGQPSLERAALERVAAALRVEPPLFPREVCDEVVTALRAELTSRDGERVQEDLEAVLLTLGPSWPGGASTLFCALLHDRHDERRFWRRSELPHALLAVALGATRSEELANRLDDLDAEAYALAQQAARCGGTKVLAAIDRRTESWPAAARSRWGFLARAVRPRGLRQFLREAAVFLTGAAVGGVGVLGLCWFGVL